MDRIHRTRLIVLACLALVFAQAEWTPLSSQSSPLARYPGFGHNAEADEARFEEEEAAREGRIARCMEREGFSYWPMTSLALEDFATPREAMAAARTHPNDRYVLLLSEEGRRRYNFALHGVEDPNAEESERLRDQNDPSAPGCVAEAHRRIPGVFAARSALTEEFHAMRQEILADQRVKAAEGLWADCMQKHGYSLSSPRALRQQMDLDLARTAGQAPLKRLGAEHRKALDSSAVCVQKSGLDAVVAATRIDYERAFVRKHRKFLNAFLRTLEQQPLGDEE